MREFTLPFKPEELLAQPADGRLWASDLPAVDDWSAQETNAQLDELIGRLLSSQGKDLAEDNSFCLLFAILQAWPRVDESIQPRVVDLLADAARRLIGEASRLKKSAKPSKACSSPEKLTAELRTASKVAAFFLRWAAERVLRQANPELGGRGRGRGRGKAGSALQQAEQASAEEAKESQRALERQRCAVLGELSGLLSRGSMPWLWLSDPASWQQAASSVSDAGFLALDSEQALKHRETKQAALRCICEPLLQEGQQHSNLLVATVSKLIHGLRSGEGAAGFAADALLMAHTTPLPRLFLVELTQHCTAQELTSQGAFQRSLAALLVAAAERLPHVVLANISVLLPLLDVDCYPLRQAIVESIGQLLAQEGRKLPSGAHCSPSVKTAEEAEEEEGDAEQEVPKSVMDTFSVAEATKKDLLETLLTRMLDKSVWVRYRVLQTITNLASKNVLPRDQWPRILELAIRRTQDTASMSRKAAMQLVRVLVEFHPYGPALKGSGDERAKAEKLMAEIAERFKKLKNEELVELEGQAAVDDEEEEPAAAGSTEEQPGKRRRIKQKTLTDQSISTEVEKDLQESGACNGDGEEGASARHEAREKKREALKRMQDCYAQRVHFVELLDAAETRLRGLLASKTATDVTEAIGVVVELRVRGVPAAARAFNQVLGLVWSRHLPIKDAAVDAFHRMHLEGRDAASAAQAILEIYREGCSSGTWTYTHLASVQELLQQAADKGLVSPAQVMPGLMAALANSASCASALRALTALAASTEGGSYLMSALPKLHELLGPGGEAVGSTAEDRLDRVRLLCQLLLRLQSAVKPPISDQVCTNLCKLSQNATKTVVEHFVRGQIPAQWFGAAQVAMDLSFELASVGTANIDAAHRCPDKVWESILRRMLSSLLGGKGGGSAVPLQDEEKAVVGAQDADDVPALTEEEVHQLAVPQLGCVAFVSGHLALRMLVYLEGMQSALKRHRMAQEEAQMAEQREKKKTEKEKKAAGKKGKKAEEKPEEEDEGGEASMGGVGQEEREAEAFAEIAEHGLLYSASRLLDRVKPLLFACLLNKDLRVNPVLRRLGAIGLCKFMTVSKRFCQENLQLLFSVLFPKGNSGPLASDDVEDVACSDGLMEDLTLRQSLLVAVGDLLFRHPNVVEPWTGRLYGTLNGPVTEGAAGSDLRLTALLVLTHLVLNDMMKPRPVLLIRALWLTACADEPTARVARILFQELSKRSTNVVYNLLPEIIARLPEHEADSGDAGGAAGRVQFIMQFVEKEKHIEGLIEKFTLRLEQSANAAGGHVDSSAQPTQAEHEAADGETGTASAEASVSCLATALGAMNYSDRCILRLHDAVVVRKAINIAISYHPVVAESLLSVVEKCRKKPGKEKAAEGPVPETEAPQALPEGSEGNSGAAKGSSAAAVSALDAIEQAVKALTQGQDASGEKSERAEKSEEPLVAARPVPQSGKTGKAAKRKAVEAAVEPGFEEEPEEKAGRGRGRGKGRGRDKENMPQGKAPQQKVAGAAGKRRKAAAVDDEE